MHFFAKRKYEILSGVTFALLLAGTTLIETHQDSLGIVDLPNMYASTVESEDTETAAETPVESSNENLSDHQLQIKERNEFDAKYQSSLQNAKENDKGREGQTIIITDRMGNERWGGYVPGSRDWTNWNNVDYEAAQNRETTSSILGHASAKRKRAGKSIDRSITRYNRTRLTSQYRRPTHVISDRHFRLKTARNVSYGISDPAELDYSNYYSSPRRLASPKTTIHSRNYARTQKPKKQDRKRLWQLLLDHGKEKKKD